MRVRKDKAVNESGIEIDFASTEQPLNWRELFGRDGPNAIEIGTGNGYFIEREAARLPEMNFIGIEREPTYYTKMMNRCARAGLGNVRTIRMDAIELLEKWIAPGTINRIYCYFSDPWPKRRHANRRVFNDSFLPLIELLLTPGGEVWFKTDVGWYFNLTVTLFRERGGWQFTEIGRLDPPDQNKGEVLTNFERKAREAGSEVWGFRAVRSQESYQND